MFLFQIFTQVTPPANLPISTNPTQDIVMFLNLILKVVFVIAGIWSLWNFISAGFKMISSGGDAKVLGTVQNQFIWTIIGIAVMISSVIVAGIIGIVAFGKWDAIINPNFTTTP